MAAAAAPTRPEAAAPQLLDTQHEDHVHDVAWDYYARRLATCSSDAVPERTTRATKRPRTLQQNATPDLAKCFPSRYDQLLQEKVDALLARLNAAAGDKNAPPPIEIFESDRTHYRMRATFKLWHEADRVHYVMFDKDSGDARMPLEVTCFEPGSRRLCALMPLVLEHLNAHAALRERVPDQGLVHCWVRTHEMVRRLPWSPTRSLDQPISLLRAVCWASVSA